MANTEEKKFDELTSLFALVDEPTNRQFLEIEPDSISPEEIGFDRTGRLRAWKQLQNAVDSINDIRQSRHGPAFVGVLGHFTAGKSSLINALLEIGNLDTPGYKRAVGPHPTDTSISLICHQNSRATLEKNPITSINDVNIIHGPDIGFLENIVLVDTPGLGNAEAEHDLAERFLHLCHVIIITVDGMVPFADTEKDFALLHKAINQLANVPKVFAITKSMAFLTHRQGEYSTDWDSDRADAFWVEGLSRIGADPRFSTASSLLESTPVCFVDSLDHHNIDQLKTIIIPITEDDSQRERIFSAQIHYLTSVAQDSIDVFDRHLANRLSNLDSLYTEARRRADAAENSISSQLISVQNAISTATKKLVAHEQTLAGQQSVWAAPEPDKALLFDRYESFTSQMQDLHSTARKLERDWKDCVQRILKSEIAAIYGISLRKPSIDTIRKLSEKARRIVVKVTTDDSQQTMAELANYYRASATSVAKNIRADQSSELFFMRFDTDKSVFTEVQQSVSGGLGQFLRVYNSAATSFVAYLTQPTSRELLAEYGLILFGDSEDVEIRAATLDVEDFPAWRQIDSAVEDAKTAIEACAKQTKKVRREAESLDDFDPTDSPFGDNFSPTEFCWNSILDNRLEQATEQLAVDAETVFERNIEHQAELRQELWSDIGDIWIVRIELLLRTAVIFGLFAGIVYGIRALDQNLYTSVANALVSDWWNMTLSIIGAALFAGLSFALIGAKGSKLVKPFTTEFRPILGYFRRGREAKKKLTREAETLLQQLEHKVASNPLDLRAKLRSVVDDWFRESEMCLPLKHTGTRIQEIQAERKSNYSTFKGMILGRMTALAQEGSTIANEKREASVEDVLKVVTDKRDLIIKLRKNLEAKRISL